MLREKYLFFAQSVRCQNYRYYGKEIKLNWELQKRDGNFTDLIQLTAIGGKGGDGGVSFYRSSIHPKGKPCGGNGGNGGDVYLECSSSLSNLHSIPRHLRANNGTNGGGKDMHGGQGSDLTVKVPAGTAVISCLIDPDTGKWYEQEDKGDHNIDNANTNPNSVVNLDDNGQRLLIAKGGCGGRGNKLLGMNNHEFERGFAGQRLNYVLDLKTIAEIGLVGMPNAGKSSFLRAVSNAHPKVAPYPFTTLNPYVGTVDFDDYTQLTVADIPGLVKGAHLNVGLGHAFLKHILKSSTIGYVVDASLPDVVSNLHDLMNELRMYDVSLLDKYSFIIANKIDKGFVAVENCKRLEREFSQMKIFPVSAKFFLGVTDVTLFLQSYLRNQGKLRGVK